MGCFDFALIVDCRMLACLGCNKLVGFDEETTLSGRCSEGVSSFEDSSPMINQSLNETTSQNTHNTTHKKKRKRKETATGSLLFVFEEKQQVVKMARGHARHLHGNNLRYVTRLRLLLIVVVRFGSFGSFEGAVACAMII